MNSRNNELLGIIKAYDKLVRNIDNEATDSESGRAYGGIIRAGKGKLVESIAKTLVDLAWLSLNQNPNRLDLTGERIRIPINQEYIDNLEDIELRRYILNNIEKYYYPYKPDVLVSIDGKKILEIECKTYTENAMLKRILVDSTLLKTQYPNMQFVLLQLESQLGGDYCINNGKNRGSPSTHTLLSYFDIDLNIITLLEGERKVDRPIHKPDFYKPLKKEYLEKAVSNIADILENYV